ncbi:MAG: AAA family ATPase, partial [Candidatus Omnitrophica bacterium]|nr:AAA family ATPase [Candidatus Omnitrophota bacterium]
NEKECNTFSLNYERNVIVEQIENTNIIIIKTFSSDPQKAALMATAIADIYIQENVEWRKKRLLAIQSYVEKQLVEYKNQLTEQEQKLQKFKHHEKVFQVNPEIKATLDRLTIEGTFEFEAHMRTLDEELKNLEENLQERANSPVLEAFHNEFLIRDSVFSGLQRRLLGLEFDRFLLLIDYTETHPAVLAQDQLISDVKERILEIIKDSIQIPVNSESEEDLSLLIQKFFLDARREVLFRIVNKFYEDSGTLSSNQFEYAELKRSVDRLLNSYEGLSKQRDEIRLNLAKIIDDVITIVSPAAVPEKPVKPNAAMNYGVSIAVGLMLGLLMGFLKESVDSSVSTIADIEHDINLPILGIIPYIGSDEMGEINDEDVTEEARKVLFQRARLVTITNPRSWPAESIKMLRTNVINMIKKHHYRTILFTSSDKQEGKSTTVGNLALSLAQLGKKTILVESNMRRPTIYKTFGLERIPGLSDILMGHMEWKQVVNTSIDLLTGGISIDDLLHIPGIDNLYVITAGRQVDNVSELLSSKAYERLLSDLKQSFDVIIIDCSPVMPVPDAITLSDKVDGVIMIYRVGQTGKDVLRMAKTNLQNAHANLLGVVLNDIRTDVQIGYSAYYYRYYSEIAQKKKSLLEKWKMPFKKSLTSSSTSSSSMVE